MPKLILLAEDSSSDELLTARALQKTGVPMEVSIARDGEEALARLLAEKTGPLPDLVLLDLKLPKLSGLDVLARLRADPRTRHLPVVILSSSDKPEDVAAAYRIGCNGYMSKGIDYSQFLESARILVQYWLVLNVPPVEEPLQK